MTKLNQSLHFFIFSLCLVFTIYQSISCVNKYLEVPESTSKRLVNLHEIEASDFPAITLCSRNDSAGNSMKLYSGFSEEKLKECGINRGFKAYYEGSEWLSVSDWTGDLLYTGENDNCTSPDKLFEYIVAKPSDLLRGAYFYYIKGDRTKVYPDLKYGMISQVDHEWYGRCFTIRPTQEMIRRGIKAIVIYSKVIKKYVPTVYFHVPGAFTWQSYQTPQQWMQGQRERQQEFYCEFEIHNRIPSKNACSLDKNFHTDLHAHLEIGNATLARFGCTTPFGPNKQTICINKTIGQEAIKFYREMWQSTHRTQSCTQFVLRPMFIRETFYTKKTYVSLKINFVPYVKITDEQLSYTFLSLLAEIGGYVGLFLGVSVNQISNLAETALNRFKIG